MHSYSQILFIDEDILGLITPVSKTLPCVSKYALCCPMSCAFCPASTWLRFTRNAFQVLLCSTWNAKILRTGIPDSTALHLECCSWIAWLRFARNASHLELRSSWDAKILCQCMPAGAALHLACLRFQRCHQLCPDLEKVGELTQLCHSLQIWSGHIRQLNKIP